MRAAWAVVPLLLLAATARAAPPEPALFVVVQINPEPRRLRAALRDEAARARQEGLKPYVEFWAPWCGSCMAFKDSLGHPRIREALTGTYIIMLNADDWMDNLRGTGFAPEVIPIFYELADSGRPTGRHMSFDDWVDDRPENMARALERFFRRR